MSSAERVATFVVFLVAFVAWFWATNKLVKALARRSLRGSTFWMSQAVVMLGYAGVFGFVALLADFYLDLRLMLAWFAAAEIAVLAGVLLRLLFLSKEPLHAGPAVAGAELSAARPRLYLWLPLIFAVGWISFLIAVSVSHFTIDESEELVKSVFRYTLLMILLSSLHAQVLVMGIMASPNLDEGNRRGFLIGQLAALLPMGLLLAVLLWSLGIAGDLTSPISLGHATLEIALPVIGGLVVWLVGLGVLPYVIGFRRAKQQKVDFLQREEELVDQLKQALSLRGSPRFRERLDRIRNGLDAELEHMMKQPLLRYLESADLESGQAGENGGEAPSTRAERDGEENTEVSVLALQDTGIVGRLATEPALFAPGEAPAAADWTAQFFEDAYQQYRPSYPPAQHLDWLKAFDADVKEVEEISRSAAKAPREDGWIVTLEERRARLAKQREEEEKARTPGIATTITVFSFVASPFIEEFASWAWERISASA